MNYLCRPELLPDPHPLPSRFWEPGPDQEDLERMEAEAPSEEWDELPFE